MLALELNTEAELPGARGFKERIRLLALRVGSMTALARAAGISQSTIRRYLGTSDPPLAALPKLARAANVSVAWLATGQGPMETGEENAYIRPHLFDPESEIPPETDVQEAPASLLFRREWLRTKFSIRTPEEQLRVFLVREHGMGPTLEVGDTILIDCTMRQPLEGFVYLLRFKKGGRP